MEPFTRACGGSCPQLTSVVWPLGRDLQLSVSCFRSQRQVDKVLDTAVTLHRAQLGIGTTTEKGIADVQVVHLLPRHNWVLEVSGA